MLSSSIVTVWCGWCSGQRWCRLRGRLWSLLTASVRRRCTLSCASTACVRMFCAASLAMKASVCLILTKHRRVSYYRNLHAFRPWKLNTRFFSSRTSARGFLIRYCFSPTAARENLLLGIWVIFNARCMSDNSSCTGPPCLGIVTDLLNIYKIVVAACNNEIPLLPQRYTVLWPPLRWLEPASSTTLNAYNEFRPQKFRSWQHHDVHYADCADKCFCPPWRFPIPGSYKLVT